MAVITTCGMIILHYEVEVSNMPKFNWSTRSSDSGEIVHLLIFLTIYNYKLLKASVENSSAQWAIFLTAIFLYG